MDSDRELLEAAARAAGIDFHVEWNDAGPTGRYRNGADGDAWNPLEDDGDALRLAVKLRMVVSLANCECCAVVDWAGNDDGNEIHVRFSEGWADREEVDPYAATRRAIVRAAAELGRRG